MADDWDLLAVVRGCCSSSTSSTSVVTSTTTAASPITTTLNSCSFDFQPHRPPPQAQEFVVFPDPPEPSTSNGNFQELNDLFRPFFPNSQPWSKPLSSFSILGGLLDPSQPATVPPPPLATAQQRPRQPLAITRTVASASTSTAVSHAPSPRSKRRKNQMKRVCEVPVEGLSSDMWSWRKYGQKPIKGSPYPRGYYKCSTSKGCLARKQVERNRSDPGMFIVTYTAEHNHPVPTHRNSLAGSTRLKGEVSGGNESGKPSSSPPVSPAAEKVESREELVEDEDDELSVSDMVIGDDFFEGLEGLTGQPPADSSSDQVPANLPFQWLANSVTPTAAGKC